MNKKKRLQNIRMEYGAIPKKKFSKKDMEYLMSSSDTIADVDEITWNDLNMDEVYVRVNNCRSFIGEQVLYQTMHHVSQDKEIVNDRQVLIRKLEEDARKREAVQLTLGKVGKGRFSAYLPMFIKDIEDYQLGGMVVYRFLTCLFIVSLLCGIFFENVLYVAGVVFVLNVVIYAIKKLALELHFEMLRSILSVMTTANTLLKKQELDFGKMERESAVALKKLDKMARKLDVLQSKMENARSGDVIAVLFDYILGSTLWDIHAFDKIVKTIAVNKSEFMQLYHYIGEVDMAISVASFRKSTPYYCTPEFTDKPAVQIAEMYHPLIQNAVANDVVMNTNYIITGSNASGKSTYVKSIAINMILAQSIHTVLGKSAEIPEANILTSMAVRDDVLSGESYYMREINYLKRIVNQLNEEKCTVCIVDEILRGTNTKERIAASVAILEYMYERNCIAIVASHDIEISRMLQGKYDNCHFSEVMGNDDITFDYKVKDGVSTSKNAIKLLEYVGFPKSIIEHANEIVDARELCSN